MQSYADLLNNIIVKTTKATITTLSVTMTVWTNTDLVHTAYMAAVKRHFIKSKYTANVKDNYIVFVEHYTRGLDWYYLKTDDPEVNFRPSTSKIPPYCMRHGSLVFACQWIKWQVENIPMKEFYGE